MNKFTLILTILISSLAFSQNEQLKKVDSIVASKVNKGDPGIMVGIVKNGKIIYEKYRGLANIEHQVKIGKKTRSNIASTSKQFTALMILQLSLEHKLSLEDDLRKYLPNLYPKVKELIKIRHLINHTSGIRDYVELMSLQNNIWWKQVGLDNDDVMRLIEKQEDLGFKPGSYYSYSNTNYNILAKIIEKVTQQKFTEYSSNFFKSLEMNNTSFLRRYMQVIPNRADPYSDWGYGELFHSISVTRTAGEGFLYTTLTDQLKFEQAIQNANSNNNILLIKSQLPIENSEIKTYGFGLKLEDLLGRRAIHHDGVTHAYNSQTLRFPEEKLTIFIMSNNGNLRSDLIANSIAEVFLPKIKKETEYNKRLYQNKNSNKSTKILGQYNYPNKETIVEIIEEKEKKYWREPNFTIEMIPLENNLFSFANDPKIRIAFYEDEMVEYYQSGKTMVYKRNKELQASILDTETLAGNYYNKELNLGFQIKSTKNNNLEFKFSNDENFQNLKVYNRINLLLNNNVFMKVKRDQFDRVIDILLTYDRAKNIKFKKKTNLKFQPKIKTEDGSIQVSTITSINGSASNILLTKNYPNGNEIWSKQYGGNSFDKASSILATENGYLIIGSTSSFGNGNYDMFIIKTDKKGKKQWQKTYGGFYNEYAYSAERTNKGYLIKGKKQHCTSNSDVFNRKCIDNVWFVFIDKNGKEISNKILEEIIPN